jgi:hypothetical protein
MKSRKIEESPQLKSPTKIKPHEAGRINLTYTDITESNSDFKPVPGVPYLWVVTSELADKKSSDEKRIIVGVEEPWKYPQAMGFSKNDPIWKENIEKQLLENKGMLGHPTLAAAFDSSSGEANLKEGKAFVGGELNFKNGHWELDNYSGRFGKVTNLHPLVALRLMDEAAEGFKKVIGEKPNINITMKKGIFNQFPSSLKTYYKEWENGGTTQVDKAINLLKIYSKPSKINLFFTGRDQRHYQKLVRDALLDFEKEKPKDITAVLDYFKNKLGSLNHPNDSLIRRLEFIAALTGNAQHFNPENLKANKISLSSVIHRR